MQMRVDPDGNVRCLYAEAIDLSTLGELAIRRVSRVEADRGGRWWADLKLIGGPRLGPYRRRSEALQAEAAWVERFLFSTTPGPEPP